MFHWLTRLSWHSALFSQCTVIVFVKQFDKELVLFLCFVLKSLRDDAHLKCIINVYESHFWHCIFILDRIINNIVKDMTGLEIML